MNTALLQATANSIRASTVHCSTKIYAMIPFRSVRQFQFVVYVVECPKDIFICQANSIEI